MKWNNVIEIARGLARSLDEPVFLKTTLDNGSAFECAVDPSCPYIAITGSGDNEEHNYFYEDQEKVLSLEWEIDGFNALKKALYAKRDVVSGTIDLLVSSKCEGVFV